MPNTILVICAHNDDGIIGAGGTLARYAEEGKRIRTIVFSYGELIKFHLQKELAIKMRVKEALDCDRILGGKGILHLGISENNFDEEIKKRHIKEKLAGIIKKENPEKIFTHSVNDPHRDHKAVYRLVKEMKSEHLMKCEVYSFEIWNIINLFERDQPKLIVDITSTFRKKSRGIMAHKSQNLLIVKPFLIKAFFKDLINGFNNSCWFAEVFNKFQ